MAKKKNKETVGLQQPKVRTAEEEVAKLEKKDEKKHEKKEKKPRRRVFREIASELKKVRWPSFGLTLKQTGVVLGVVVLFSLVVFGIDQGLSALHRLLIPEIS